MELVKRTLKGTRQETTPRIERTVFTDEVMRHLEKVASERNEISERDKVSEKDLTEAVVRK